MRMVTYGLLLLLPTYALWADENGEWTLNRSHDAGKVVFSLQSSSSDGRHFNSSSDWDVGEFKGLDWSTPAKHDVEFKIVRDAGIFECQGFVSEGRGAGLFTFHPDGAYIDKMNLLGFRGVTVDKQVAFALHNVSLAFAREIKGAGIKNVDAEKLIAFRIFGVSADFIADLRTAGIDEQDADKLIPFRIHGVSPEFVRGLRASGVAINDSDKLIAFRIHGVSPEYVRALQQLGYPHPDPDKLIALRIHGVTPEYIESLHSHGMQNLTLDQLVALRIHGIN